MDESFFHRAAGKGFSGSFTSRQKVGVRERLHRRLLFFGLLHCAAGCVGHGEQIFDLRISSAVPGRIQWKPLMPPQAIGLPAVIHCLHQVELAANRLAFGG
ncbi:MAG TPA: hypothetical protein VMH85_02815, partial [Terriglobales bacterium]|nr:hypothetical protein [Terriglobales bacterium]